MSRSIVAPAIAIALIFAATAISHAQSPFRNAVRGVNVRVGGVGVSVGGGRGVSVNVQRNGQFNNVIPLQRVVTNRPVNSNVQFQRYPVNTHNGVQFQTRTYSGGGGVVITTNQHQNFGGGTNYHFNNRQQNFPTNGSWNSGNTQSFRGHTISFR